MLLIWLLLTVTALVGSSGLDVVGANTPTLRTDEALLPTPFKKKISTGLFVWEPLGEPYKALDLLVSTTSHNYQPPTI